MEVKQRSGSVKLTAHPPRSRVVCIDYQDQNDPRDVWSARGSGPQEIRPMSKTNPSRRQRVKGRGNHNLYSRVNAAGKTIYEIGLRVDGRQTYKTVGEKISAARAARDEALAQRSRGEQVASNGRLKFSEAADRWLQAQTTLRPSTRNGYRNSVEKHLGPRFGNRVLSKITANDWASLVADLRAAGKAETTIQAILCAARLIYKYAARRLNWHGTITLSLLERSERPKTSAATKARIFRRAELAQTLDASLEPFKQMFTLGSVVGPRISETVGLVWGDLDLSNLDEASISFAFQLDRQTGERVSLKTEDSAAQVDIPRSMAMMLATLKLKSAHSQPDDFVFATRTGRAIGQRNVSRELRRAQTRAKDPEGNWTFPELHETDANGETLKPKRGTIPSFHSLRHTAASWALADGDSAEEVSWMLRHGNSDVTRRIYLHQVRTAERSAATRKRLEERYEGVLGG